MSDATISLYNLLSGMIGGDVTAVYAISLPADAEFPCAVYSQVYGGDGTNVSGGTGSTYKFRFQIDLFHPTLAGLMNLRASILSGFHLYTGNGILNTRIDLDIPYVMDELDLEKPGILRHIIGLSLDADRAVA